MRKTKEQKGITLIALIITIIILIVLSIVTIGVIKRTGIIEISRKAKDDYTKQEKEQKLRLDAYQNILDLKAMYTVADAQIKGVLSETQVTYVIDTYNNVISLPAGFKITKDGNTVPEGIVIEDCTDSPTKGSQFVWIPVGTINKENETQLEIKLGRYVFNNDGSINKEASITDQESADFYNGEGFKDATTTNAHAKDIEEYVSSTNRWGGYYLSRYEARTKKERTYSDKTLTQLTTRGKDYVYYHVTQKQASKLSRGMYNADSGTNVTSDLVNRFAWDTAIVYIQEMGNEAYSVQTRKTNKVAEKGTNNFENVNEQDEVCNIWDISSNYLEWSTENCSCSGANCVMRGGYWDNISRYTACRFPYYNKTEKDTCSWCSFRPILYVSLTGKATVWTQDRTTVKKGEVTLNVGDFVDYKANVSGYTDTNGWRVIGAVDGQILLISSKNVADEVALGFSATYCQSELGSICSQYGNGTYATGVRSVEMNDITRVTAEIQDLTTLR